ncbi:MAG TPA: metalloregulator ArsR/SmtB family transcription factor [Rhizomicrobium sp.]|jgi:DNA-binding transcriptional ArsR family regulator|nr:metalloregulator ArsR/SmtB family transcription factor [Rhizomicrobium sp.]
MTETLLEFFKAMAHDSRLRIVGLLAQGERSVQELAAALGLKEPTVSHHLAILKAQGIVTARAEGTTRWHALDRAALERLAQRVLQPASQTLAAPAGTDAWETKVLQAFVDAGGKLKQIPASRKKRGVVLRWLMRAFAPGRRYGEAEVNDIIQARHWDCATLRRELVGHHMLARKDRIYWRLPEADWKRGGEA